MVHRCKSPNQSGGTAQSRFSLPVSFHRLGQTRAMLVSHHKCGMYRALNTHIHKERTKKESQRACGDCMRSLLRVAGFERTKHSGYTRLP
eukprot:4907736-Pyramimonas_sp.AAC.1